MAVEASENFIRKFNGKALLIFHTIELMTEKIKTLPGVRTFGVRFLEGEDMIGDLAS